MRRSDVRPGVEFLDLYDGGQSPAEFCQTDAAASRLDFSVGETAADFLEVAPADERRGARRGFASELARYMTPVIRRMEYESSRLRLVDGAVREYTAGDRPERTASHKLRLV